MSDSMERPRLPRLTVRVGVTGHRPHRLNKAKDEELRGSIRRVLLEIVQATLQIRAEAEGALYNSKPPLLRVISPLAEGADRLVAEVALAEAMKKELEDKKVEGFELQCPLPFSRSTYALDFPDSENEFAGLLNQAKMVLELDGVRGDDDKAEDQKKRRAAYLAVGRVVLRQCDVLIAIWDGGEAEGAGGTTQIVQEALSIDLPTVWIHPSNPDAIGLLSPRPDGIEQSEIRTPAEEEGLDGLIHRLRESFLPSSEIPQEHQPWSARVFGWVAERCRHPLPRTERDRAWRFFQEKDLRTWHSWGYNVYRYAWTRIGRKKEEKKPPGERSAQDIFFDERPVLKERARKFFKQHYEGADRLADACVGRFRSSFVLTYLLGALAVLCAFFGILLGHHRGVWWFVGELFLIIIILAITFLGRLYRTHERWMDNRSLAEALRQMEFLDLLARVPSSFKVPAHLAASDPRRSWFHWYFRALVREAGMIGGSAEEPLVFDEAYREGFRSVLAEAVKNQVKYHGNNHHTLHTLHHRSHWAAQLLFVAVAVGCVMHLCTQPPLMDHFLSFVAIVLPGFGAAFAAISHHGEFERVALRSKAFHGRLLDLLCRLAPEEELCKGRKVAGRMAAPVASTSQALGSVAGDFSDLMINELLDWRFAFLGKDLTLPA